ncbi:MAG: signal peptidase I [Rhodobiaceae bacterium]|nr:signal peptidase I [Rhodobiaceae bacterium]
MSVDWKDAIKTVSFTLLAILAMRTTVFASYYIPSESMVPTLEVGDRLIITKWDYGYSRHSLPFGIGQFLPASSIRLFEQLPDLGDIVVFDHPQNPGVDMIKRVIGLPGDEIKMENGRLLINGTVINRTRVHDYIYAGQAGREIYVRQFTEDLPGAPHSIIERSDNGRADNTRTFHVPSGHLFMVGDNRDNSGDSRFASLSYVPMENLIGRARLLPFSLHTCPRVASHLTCAPKRYLSTIQ